MLDPRADAGFPQGIMLHESMIPEKWTPVFRKDHAPRKKLTNIFAKTRMSLATKSSEFRSYTIPATHLSVHRRNDPAGSAVMR
jgi:hypothetical protein